MLALLYKNKAFVAACYVLFGFTMLMLCGGILLINCIRTAPKLNIEELSLDFTSFIYATAPQGQGEEILIKLHDGKNRVWVSLSDIPSDMQNAIISIEDKRYWRHNGIDIKRTLHAAFDYIFRGETSFGGSTITQQLVKNLTQNDEITVKRKIQEMWLAFRLERQIGKQRVLELYLNTVFFGEGAYGVQAAAYSYFGKDVSELSLAQAASIAGITQLPQRYNPFINENENRIKKEIVLSEMLKNGYISREEYDNAISEVLTFTKESQQRDYNKCGYFIDQVVADVMDDLQNKKGYTRAMASKLIYTGGLKIYATVDMGVQEALEKVFADDKNFPDDASGDKTNAAMIVIDPYSGEVKGIVGGRGEKKGMLTLNRATQTVRQPGSSIKPISVYAPAIDHAIITPKSVLTDAPYTVGGWTPRNWYKGYRGSVTVQKAVEQSINVVAVKVLALVGIERSFSFLENNLGITTLADKEIRDGKEYSDKNYSSLALGGLTDGVTVQEMAAAYVPFINRGIYIKPHTYSKVVAHSGEVIFDNRQNPESHVAIREQAAYYMTQMLSAAVKSGTGTAARLSVKMPAAGKTGTTSDDKDRWFVGYTPYYVGAVWFGYDTPKPMERLLAGRPNPAAVIWKKAMDIIHRDLPYRDFPDVSWSRRDENRGTITFPDKRIYEGELKDGKAEGYGVMIYPNGDRYCGYFSGNMREGEGILLCATGNSYKGEFRNDEINGFGTYLWQNGDRYTGQFKDGKFNGEGTFEWISGNSYTGQWLNEKFHGFGTFRWASGEVMSGQWYEGDYIGE
ncbi:MAG: Penicillin-binding protein 1F [Firmicutes bacterium ADurb.Bin193]|nr:MAG: Penicillin-binding protein 1F [Firmicutes bacterium ADurb.Bin193]